MSDMKKDFGSASNNENEVEVPREYEGKMLVSDPFDPGASAVLIDGEMCGYKLEELVILPISDFYDEGDDDFFVHAVVINIKQPDLPDTKALAKSFGAELPDNVENRPNLYGGFINEDMGCLITEDDFTRPEREDLVKLGPLMVSYSADDVGKLLSGERSEKHAFVLGILQWTKSDLDEQVKSKMLHVIDMNPALLFDVDIEDRYNEALKEIGYDPEEVKKMKESLKNSTGYKSNSLN